MTVSPVPYLAWETHLSPQTCYYPVTPLLTQIFSTFPHTSLSPHYVRFPLNLLIGWGRALSGKLSAGIP